MLKNARKNSIAKPLFNIPAHEPSQIYPKSIQDDIVYLKYSHSGKILERFHDDNCRNKCKDECLKIFQLRKTHPENPNGINIMILPKTIIMIYFQSILF